MTKSVYQDKLPKHFLHQHYYVYLLIVLWCITHKVRFKTETFVSLSLFQKIEHNPTVLVFSGFIRFRAEGVYIEERSRASFRLSLSTTSPLYINSSHLDVFVRQHCGTYFRTWKVLSIQTFSNGPRRLAFSPQSLRLNRAGCLNNICTSGKEGEAVVWTSFFLKGGHCLFRLESVSRVTLHET